MTDDQIRTYCKIYKQNHGIVMVCDYGTAGDNCYNTAIRKIEDIKPFMLSYLQHHGYSVKKILENELMENITILAQ